MSIWKLQTFESMKRARQINPDTRKNVYVRVPSDK